MIDIAHETLLTFEQAAEKLQVSKATVYRWVTHGSNDIKLEALKLGGIWRTSVEAVQRFAERLTPAQEPTNSALPPVRSPAQQRRHQIWVEEELDKIMGVRKCETCRRVIEAKNAVIPKEEKLWCPDCLIKRRSATMGQRIRTFRWAANLSQQALAHLTGIRIEKIRAFETNETKPLDAQVAVLIKVLGDKLLSGLG